MTTVLFGPSEKQVGFIKSLLAQRDIDEDVAQVHLANLATMDKATASKLIDALLQLPKAARPANTPLQTALASIPKSKYAVHTEDLQYAELDADLHGDILFLEVREYMGHLYMRQLTGALGGFNRIKLVSSDAIQIANIIARDPYKHAMLFGKVYTCCGSCGAELTDPTSRELQLGPECRKKFGK